MSRERIIYEEFTIYYKLNCDFNQISSTKDDHLEIQFNNRNQLDDKIAWGIGGGFLFFQISNIETFLMWGKEKFNVLTKIVYRLTFTVLNL